MLLKIHAFSRDDMVAVIKSYDILNITVVIEIVWIGDIPDWTILNNGVKVVMVCHFKNV